MFSNQTGAALSIGYLLTALVGIMGTILLADCIINTTLGKGLSALGGATLYIYLMHRVALYYLNGVLKIAGIDFVGLDILVIGAVVISCFYLGNWLASNKLFIWLVKAP